MAICPAGAITIHGRELSPDDLYESPPPEAAATYPQLTALLERRRSIKKFREKYGIACKSREGLFLAVGYPALSYKKSLKRTFASIHYQEPQQ